MKAKITLLVLFLVTTTFIHAQHFITGVVTDNNNETLPGVTIVVDGEVSMGTVTDMDGKYSLKVKNNAVLKYAYVGFVTQSVVVKDQKEINVVLMAEQQEIEEVVVTAMGIKQQKKKIGYATQKVNAQVIEQSAPINMGNALTGQVAGLTVNNPTGIFQKPTFSLRGKDPLIVLDGIPIESDLFDVSSSDIESVNVLKGTSASALYGARGRNGAILITTKRANKEGIEVTASVTSMATAGFTVYPETQHEYGSGSNGNYEFWDGAGGGIEDGDMTWGPKYTPGLKIAQWNSPIRNKATGETIPWYGDVTGSIYDDRSKYERVPIPFESHDNLKEYLGTGSITKANFSIANKGAKGNTFISGNYSFQNGQVPNTRLSTGGLTFNGSYKLAKNVTFSPKLSYNKVISPNYPRYGYGPKNHIYTILLWMSDDVDMKDLKDHLYRPDMYGYRQANYNYAWYNNPYFMTEESTQKYNKDVVTGQGTLLWDILPNLNLQGRTSARVSTDFQDLKVPKSYKNYSDSREGDFKNWNNREVAVNSDVKLSYTAALTNDLQLTTNAGIASYYEQEQQEYQQTDGLIIPQIYNMGNSMGPVKATNSFEEQAINSIYATVGLDIYKSVFLNFTARNDWSSTLPKSNSSYFYPSVSLSTMVSDYIKMPKAISFLKLYTSWAQVSSDLEPYSLTSTYSNSTLYGNTPSVTYPNELRNPDIASQQSNSFEAGLSTAFLKNRITLDFTYYHVLDKNQIIDLPISHASGFKSRKVNGNEYTTNGYELVLGAKAISHKNFSWDIATNLYTNIKKLTSIYDGLDSYNNLVVGDRADAIYTTEWQMTPDRKVILDAKTGMPTANPYLSNVGNANPDLRFGFQNKFNIHGFRVNMNFDGAIGGTLVSTTTWKLWWGGKHPNSTKYRDAEAAAGGNPVYVPDGVIVTGGSVTKDARGNIITDTRTYTTNTRAVHWQEWCQTYPENAIKASEDPFFATTFNRSYLKLRELSVGYDLAKFMKKSRIKSLEVSLFANNVFVIKNTPFIDPDYGASDGDLQDPSSRYIGMGATVKF